jgi:hypothetical protein
LKERVKESRYEKTRLNRRMCAVLALQWTTDCLL